MAKDDEYMHEMINRLEGDRDYWKRRSTQFERAVKLITKRLTTQQMEYVAEVCRNVGGACFCGCHTSAECLAGLDNAQNQQVAAGCDSVPPEPKEIARVPYNDGHCILRDDFMVVIECSGGRDMLPVSLVSQKLVDAFEAQMKAKDSSS